MTTHAQGTVFYPAPAFAYSDLPEQGCPSLADFFNRYGNRRSDGQADKACEYSQGSSRAEFYNKLSNWTPRDKTAFCAFLDLMVHKISIESDESCRDAQVNLLKMKLTENTRKYLDIPASTYKALQVLINKEKSENNGVLYSGLPDKIDFSNSILFSLEIMRLDENFTSTTDKIAPHAAVFNHIVAATDEIAEKILDANKALTRSVLKTLTKTTTILVDQVSHDPKVETGSYRNMLSRLWKMANDLPLRNEDLGLDNSHNRFCDITQRGLASLPQIGPQNAYPDPLSRPDAEEMLYPAIEAFGSAIDKAWGCIKGVFFELTAPKATAPIRSWPRIDPPSHTHG